jgi:superfamily I DNA/RNA helicase
MPRRSAATNPLQFDLFSAPDPAAPVGSAARTSGGLPPPNEQQRAVLEWVEHGSGNGIIRSVAGSGKTTLLQMVAQLQRLQRKGSRALMTSFSRAITKELTTRVRGTVFRAKGMHALGLATWKQNFPAAKLDETKYKALAAKWLELIRAEDYLDLDQHGELVESERRGLPAAIAKWLEMARHQAAGAAITTETLEEVLAEFDIRIARELEPWVTTVALRALREGRERTDALDFTDMLDLPLRAAQAPGGAAAFPFPTYDWLLIDECQDFTPLMIEFVLQLRADHGRVLAVGDPQQSIFGFAGADTKAWERFRDELRATEFGLSVCFRCPASHIQRAAAYVPDIRPRSGAPDGRLGRANWLDLVGRVKPGDMILSRTNRPLIQTAFRLLRAGKPARVKLGSHNSVSFDRKLLRAAQRLEDLLAETPDLARAVKLSCDRELAQLKKLERLPEHVRLKKEEEATEIAACLLAFVESSGATSTASLVAHIEEMFGDGKAVITLSTVHRAKGLEADVVWLLEPDRLRQAHEGAFSEDDQQELNVAYVAYTRARLEMWELDVDSDADAPMLDAHGRSAAEDDAGVPAQPG